MFPVRTHHLATSTSPQLHLPSTQLCLDCTAHSAGKSADPASYDGQWHYISDDSDSSSPEMSILNLAFNLIPSYLSCVTDFLLIWMYNKAGKCCQMSPISLHTKLSIANILCVCLFVSVCVCACTWLTRPGWSGTLHINTQQQQMLLNHKAHDKKHLQSQNLA